MTENENNSLTKTRLKSLITAARKYVPQEENVSSDAVDFNWEEPHHFNLDQLGMLDIIVKRIEAQLEKVFSAMCEGEFSITMAPITQHFAFTLAAKIPLELDKHYFLPLTIDMDKCGYLAIDPDSALLFVEQMLRDTESESEPGRELSSLEETILMDVASAIADAIDKSIREHSGPSLETFKELSKGDWPLYKEGIEDITCLDISVEHAAGTMSFTFGIFSDIIEPMLGAKAVAKSEYSTKDIKNMIMESMHYAPVEVCAELCSTVISLNDVMSLSEGDLLVLDKKIDEPIEVLFNRCPGMKAYPATHLGKYAVVMAGKDV